MKLGWAGVTTAGWASGTVVGGAVVGGAVVVAGFAPGHRADRDDQIVDR